MPDVVQETHQEFWRPPSPPTVELQAAPVMVEVCARCGSEFLFGSRFCHTCGHRRLEAISAAAKSDAAEMAGLWENGIARLHSTVTRLAQLGFWHRMTWPKIQIPDIPDRFRFLHFHEIQRRIGLSTASLVAFLAGISCVTGALAVGFITAKTLVEWQAIQIYRVEWLLAATVAFVAAILLKKPSGRDS